MFCYACKNDINEVNSLYLEEGAPLESSENVVMTFSDSGIVQIKMIAPKLEKYERNDGVELEWPNGIDVVFYESEGVVKSSLTAKKAILFEKDKYMLVQNKVVFSNVDNEKLETEELKIYFAQDSLYSDKFVKITTKNGLLTGQKMISNLSFTKYRILTIRESYYNIEIEE